MADTRTPKQYLDATLVDTTSTQTLTNKGIDGATATEVSYLSGVTSAIQTQINGKQTTVTLTTTGTSGAATFNATTGALNIPNYATSGSISTPSAIGLSAKNNATTPNTQIDITFTSAVLVTTVGAGILAAGTTVTINAATTGANGLDTGSLAASTWYNLYLISSGTTTAALASLSATSPTMPSGYTYRYRIGAFITDASSVFRRIIIVGRRGQYVVSATGNTTAIPAIYSNATTGSVTTPTYTAFSITGFVPPTAAEIDLVVKTGTAAADVLVAPNANYGAFNATLNTPPLHAYGTSTTNMAIRGSMVLESTSIYIAASGGAVSQLVGCVGWFDNI